MKQIRCPNKSCLNYKKPNSTEFKKDGIYFSKIADTERQKYKCKICGKKFSELTFSPFRYGKYSLKMGNLLVKNFDKYYPTDILIKKMGVSKKTFLKSIRLYADLWRGSFFTAPEYKGTVIYHHASKKEISVIFGFYKGIIVDVGIGDYKNVISKEWLIENEISKRTRSKSLNAMLDRMVIFSKAYNYKKNAEFSHGRFNSKLNKIQKEIFLHQNQKKQNEHWDIFLNKVKTRNKSKK